MKQKINWHRVWVQYNTWTDGVEGWEANLGRREKRKISSLVEKQLNPKPKKKAKRK